MKEPLIERGMVMDVNSPVRGVTWEDWVGELVQPRRWPWSNIEPDEDFGLGNSVNAMAGFPAQQQSAENAGQPSAGGTLTLRIVTDVRDSGSALQYKTRQLQLIIAGSGPESDWTTFAQTSASC